MLSLLSAFLLCSWHILLECGSISRFKGVFRGFCGADVYLYRLSALRGLCGFCARVELGGFGACGVFCLSFCQIVLQIVLLLVLFCSCPAWLLSCSLSCFLGFVAWLLALVGLLFLFPLRTIHKKKGRNSLRPLLFYCGVFRFLYSYRKTPSLCIWLFPVRPVGNAN